MRKFLACLLVTTGLSFAPTPASSGETASHVALIVNTPSNKIRVVNANLLQGLWNKPKLNDNGTYGETFDNRNLLQWLAHPDQAYVPDILTIQNLDWDGVAPHRATCADTRDYLATATNNTYGSYTNNTRGGACILYRSARFTPSGQPSGGIGNLYSPAGWACGSDRSGQRSVGIRLLDNLTGKVISVASVHMGLTPCTENNIKEVRNWVNQAGDVKLVLGDFNIKRQQDAEWQTLKALMLEKSFIDAKIWSDPGTRDYFWHKGFAGISALPLVDWYCCGYPTPTVRFSDHRAGVADLTL